MFVLGSTWGTSSWIVFLKYCDTFFFIMAKSPQATSITIPEQNVFAHLQLRSATPGGFVNYVGMF